MIVNNTSSELSGEALRGKLIDVLKAGGVITEEILYKVCPKKDKANDIRGIMNSQIILTPSSRRIDDESSDDSEEKSVSTPTPEGRPVTDRRSARIANQINYNEYTDDTTTITDKQDYMKPQEFENTKITKYTKNKKSPTKALRKKSQKTKATRTKKIILIMKKLMNI